MNRHGIKPLARGHLIYHLVPWFSILLATQNFTKLLQDP